MRTLLAIALAALVGLAGCQRPSLEGEQARLDQAAAAGAAQLSELDAKDYRAGFVNGAAMVQSAVRQGRRPFLLRPKGPAQGLQVELDPATGLEFATAVGEGPFARGQVDGFRFLFEPQRTRFVQPKPAPALPQAWEPWPAENGSLLLVAGTRHVDCRLLDRALAWTDQEAGFPPVRRWRNLPMGLRPHHAALGSEVIWFDSEQGAFAVDLASGLIRRLEATQSHAPLTFEAQEAERRRALARVRPDMLTRAMAGDLDAMVWLGQASDDPAESARWFRQAAEGGHAEGMFLWATRLYQGRGVAEDRAASRSWFQRAEAEGHPSAKAVLEGLFQAP